MKFCFKKCLDSLKYFEICLQIMSANAATVTFVPFFGFTACLFIYLLFCKVETLLVTGRTYRLVYHLDIFVKSCLWMPNEQGCDKIHIQRGCHPVILSPLVWRDVTYFKWAWIWRRHYWINYTYLPTISLKSSISTVCFDKHELFLQPRVFGSVSPSSDVSTNLSVFIVMLKIIVKLSNIFKYIW